MVIEAIGRSAIAVVIGSGLVAKGTPATALIVPAKQKREGRVIQNNALETRPCVLLPSLISWSVVTLMRWISAVSMAVSVVVTAAAISVIVAVAGRPLVVPAVLSHPGALIRHTA